MQILILYRWLDNIRSVPFNQADTREYNDSELIPVLSVSKVFSHFSLTNLIHEVMELYVDEHNDLQWLSEYPETQIKVFLSF